MNDTHCFNWHAMVMRDKATMWMLLSQHWTVSVKREARGFNPAAHKYSCACFSSKREKISVKRAGLSNADGKGSIQESQVEHLLKVACACGEGVYVCILVRIAKMLWSVAAVCVVLHEQHMFLFLSNLWLHTHTHTHAHTHTNKHTYMHWCTESRR